MVLCSQAEGRSDARAGSSHEDVLIERDHGRLTEREAVRFVGGCGRMLLWMSSGGRWGAGGDEMEEFAGYVAFEAANDLGFGHAFFGALLGVGAGGGVSAQSGQHDLVEGCVGAAVATAVESMPVGFARGCRDRSGPAEHRE